jgi:phenylpropionate dioxygenase-like ring-hydroxylating dioxygenase large terminal subunit
VNGTSQDGNDFGRVDRELWETHWHLLAHRSELASPSRFVAFNLAGEEVVAFHDGASVVVFDNRCPHRGTRIFDGSHGQQRFLCRYHGWSYAKGRLFVPERKTFAGCDPTQARLNTYETAWLGDFLFVSRRPAQALSEQLVGIEVPLEGISRSIASRGDFNAYPYLCNWKIAVENALDQYHVAIIHRNTLNRLRMEPARDEYFGVNNISRAGVGDERVEKRLRSLARLFDFDFQDEGYIAIYIFPFTFLTSTFGYSYSLQQFHPSSDPQRTNFTSRFYTSRLAPRIGEETMRTFFESSLAVNHDVFREDAEICARVPTDSWSPDPPAYLSAGEEKIAHFRATMARLIAVAAVRGERPPGFPVD